MVTDNTKNKVRMGVSLCTRVNIWLFTLMYYLNLIYIAYLYVLNTSKGNQGVKIDPRAGESGNYAYISSSDARYDNFHPITMGQFNSITDVYCIEPKKYYSLSAAQKREVTAHFENLPTNDETVQGVAYHMDAHLLRLDFRGFDDFAFQPPAKQATYNETGRGLISMSCELKESLPLTKSQAAIILSIILLFLSAQKFRDDLTKLMHTGKIIVRIVRRDKPIQQLHKNIHDRLRVRAPEKTSLAEEPEEAPRTENEDASPYELEETKAVFVRCLSCGCQITPVNYVPLYFSYYSCTGCLASQTLMFIASIIISIGAALISVIAMNVDVIRYLEGNIGPRFSITLNGFNGIYLLLLIMGFHYVLQLVGYILRKKLK